MRVGSASRKASASLLVIGALAACDRTDFSSGPSIAASRRADTGSGPPPVGPGELDARINEIMLENTSTLEDETGAFPPAWVEIYNTSDEELDLAGIPLSDDLIDTEKWRFPGGGEAALPPRGFLVVFLDGAAEAFGGLHASFIPQETLGSVQLILNKGSDIVFLESGRLAADQSAGRHPDGADSVARLEAPTPGGANSDPVEPIETQGQFVRGDANSDNRVDVSDMSLILRVLFRSAPGPDCRDRLDADDTGEVNVTDATFIGNAIFHDGPAMPAPFPERGVDPTPDGLICPP